MKKIPYGKTDFKELIEQNCYYVDKTAYLIDMEKNADVLTYLRPRRFGKTLFTSMMFYYYDINNKNLFDALFKGTKIYNDPTPNKNNYYVLRFDFSGIGVQDKDIKEIERAFVNKVNNALTSFNDYYELGLNLRLDTIVSNSLDNFVTDFRV